MAQVYRFIMAKRDRKCVVLYLAPNRKIPFTIADPEFAVTALRIANRRAKRRTSPHA